MFKKNPILKGTMILTITGFITRLMGFVFRIFMSHIFSETEIGMYQLIFPVYALGFSITSAGIELALAKCVSANLSIGNKKRARELLYTGMMISLILSSIVLISLQHFAHFISVYYLNNENTYELLLILSYIFPFSSIHSCIVGYYLGHKSTKVPALSQFIEQFFRITSVLVFYALSKYFSFEYKIPFAVLGLLIGEITSCTYCLFTISKSETTSSETPHRIFPFIRNCKELLQIAIPITANRVFVNLLQSVEAISIPRCLHLYGLSSENALRLYGIFSGMVLPCILFPSAITNAFSTMLLPTVSEIHTSENQYPLYKLFMSSTVSCIVLGFCSCIFFVVFGNFIGSLLFNNQTAGYFLIIVAWICPFLYVNTTLASIINGTGKTAITFIMNLISLFIRIVFVLFFIPLYGIYGYLIGLFISQILLFSFYFCYLYKKFKAKVI